MMRQEADYKKSWSYLAPKRSVVLSPDKVRPLNDGEQMEEFEMMIDENVRGLFGKFDLEVVLCQRYQALGVFDNNDKLAGVVVFNNYPNICSISPSDWEQWLHNLYGLSDVNSRNTLWIQLLLYDQAYYNFFLTPIMQFLFKRRCLIKYCIMVVPPGKHKTDFFNNLGIAVLPKGEIISKKSNQYLYVMSRNNLVLHYKLRKAVEEDNADLIPLIDAYCPTLKEMYGSYYVAEIITRFRDSGRQIVVAEYDGVAVAVLCLNEYINYEILNKQFELIPYNGLKKPHAQDKSSIFIDLFSHSTVQLPTDTEDIHELQRETTGSVFTGHETEELVTEDSEEFSIQFTGGSMFLFLDDEEGPLMALSLHSDEIVDSESQEILTNYYDRSHKYSNLFDKTEMASFQTLSKEEDKVPEFQGEPNAFALEIVAAHPDHQNSLMNLFEAAFHCFSDREYCVITIPSTVSVSKEFKYFARVARRPTGEFPHELYVMHRNSLFGDVQAKKIEDESNLYDIRSLLSKIPNSQEIIAQIKSGLKTCIYQSFILLCAKEIVGVSTVRGLDNLEYLKAHYNLSAVINPHIHFMDRHGIIENSVISPIFLRHSNYFLREIHRLSQFDILYYKLTPSDASDIHRSRPLLNFLPNMLHVMPRRRPEYDLKVLEENECLPPRNVTSTVDESSALFLSSMSVCGTFRYVINHKIVILGCSSTALAFLESLIFKQDPQFSMLFNNVTVIYHSGLSFTITKIREIFFVKKHLIDVQYLDLLGLKSFVNFVESRVTKINRKDKVIILNDNTHMKYDLLFMMCGEIFQRPLRLSKYPFEETPDNVFIINSHYDVSNALTKLRQYRTKNRSDQYTIIIYGHNLQSYCTLEGLLACGVPGNHLVFIENFPLNRTMEKRQKHNVTIFNNPDIDAVVGENIAALGIKMYSSYYFTDWTFDSENNVITSARFESRHKMLEFKCVAMFCFNDKAISSRLQKVMKDAGLVYDGRLVIDHNCRTNDPNIYAAGTITKYSRRYYAQSKAHKFYNRMEIGHCLGLAIKQLLSPHSAQRYFKKKTEWNIHVEKSNFMVPTYYKPIMRYCRLPSGLYYLSIVKPGRRVPLETALSGENYGRILVTGDCRNLTEQGFFRLHLNHNRRVETITCLSKFPLDIQNLYCLWGKSETLLNNLTQRFEMVLITDFFDYFREPWAYAIYHDKFNDLMDELNYLMTSAIGFSGTSILNRVISEYKNVRWMELTQDTQDDLEEEFKRMPYSKIIEQKVLDFLKENISHLPMYAHPVIVRDILKNFESSPMFT